MKKYSIGIDFGTLSARAVLADVSSGEIMASDIYEYGHGVIEQQMPDGTRLPEGFALQDPGDYLEAVAALIPGLLSLAGIAADQVIGVGTDFTSSTMIPVKKDGTPLCRLEQYRNRPFAYAVLWKHHASQKAADQINKKAEETGQEWLDRYGGKISSEWSIPKLLQMYEEDQELYEQTDVWVEAVDWIVWQLTGIENHSYSTMEFKAIWDQKEGFPAQDFFRKLAPGFEQEAVKKLGTNFLPQGVKAGGITSYMAQVTGLKEGTPVSSGIVDAYACLPAVGIDGAGKMLLIVGTSVCEILVEPEGKDVPGLCGRARDGILPGYYAHEGAQSAGGDILAWFTKICCSGEMEREAEKKKISLHTLLTEKAARLRPGETGLLALDWWNGNNCILDDMYLSGMIVGLTLSSRPEEIYRAIMESIVFGSRINVEQFQKHGILVEQILAAGGICKKNEFMMQIYADVLNMPVHVSAAEQGPALGSAMFGAVAAGKKEGGYDSIYEAISKMKAPVEKIYNPVPDHVKVYDELFLEYKKLHDYFGCGGNDVMYRLRHVKTGKCVTNKVFGL